MYINVLCMAAVIYSSVIGVNSSLLQVAATGVWIFLVVAAMIRHGQAIAILRSWLLGPVAWSLMLPTMCRILSSCPLSSLGLDCGFCCQVHDRPDLFHSEL
jgi:hypothetical protein